MPNTTTAEMAGVRVTPLEEPFGARIQGINRAANWDSQTHATVQQALLDHHVLVFPGETMEPQCLLALARRFGDCMPSVNREKRLNNLPEVTRIDSTIKSIKRGKDTQFHIQSSLRAEEWHTDQSFVEHPAKATILHAHEVPAEGGATWFCNTAAAYDSMPEEKKRQFATLKAVHSYDTKRARHRPAVRSQTEIDESPDVIHPLVRTHPDSERKGLYLNFNRLDHILGLDRAKSDAILDYLASWVAQDRFIYRHKWSVGDVVVWDNRCTMHRVSYDSAPGDRRIMYRAITRGDRPV
ncbi:MAG: TauD/TfdA dioxygenase family protein [Rhodospirillales bacterium]|jgi:taurine dioxygenase